ncbi:MAG: flavodoxin [Chitinophagales bacterium]|nr:flavodoxin [Chitinophagales bacterium]
MEQVKALIVYASMTGCNEEIAFLLSKEFEKLNIKTEVAEVDEASVKEFLNKDICVVCTYSYESYGEILPEEMLDFYDDLEQLDLRGKVFGVLGSGQDFYTEFCGAVDRFDKQFPKTGATKGSEPFKIDWDIETPEDEEKLRLFAKNIYDKCLELKAVLVAKE